MNCSVFDHEIKTQKIIDCCIDFRLELVVIDFSCFITMEFIDDGKGISKRVYSIVQHSHAQTCS